MSQEENPVARVPRGFRDIAPQEVLMRDEMIATIKKVYQSYGFSPLETPAVEYLDALGKYLPDIDQPDGGVFAFKDDSSNWVALRYDLTAPLARYVSENEKELPMPFRRYQIGPVYRLEKPGPGRFREFYQCDFDTVGAPSVAADAEVCCILSDGLKALGISPDDYVIKVNNRKVLNGVIETAKIGSGGEGLDENALIVMRAMDKLDRIGIEGVIQLLGEGRKDESGDFTKGAGLDAGQVDKIKKYLEIKSEKRTGIVEEMFELVKDSETGREGTEELRIIDELLTASGYSDERVVFDPMIVRGLAYYTGPVFEAALTFEVKDENGQPKQFGSVAGGGRYDTLVERFLNRKVPATGASIGIDRLLAALVELGTAGKSAACAPVLVTTMDKNYMAEYQKLAVELREAGFPAELFMGSGGFRKQMKYADRRELPLAIICGEDEFRSGQVSIKDLMLGKEMSKEIDDRAEWVKDRPAQVTVQREEMIETVRKMLAEYNG
ncbi:MAG TPA: histidine--tRNA ligase [bacterium]|nr:histidine--tRNA ligase [bacterium]